MMIDGESLGYEPVECHVEALGLRWGVELLVGLLDGPLVQAWAEANALMTLRFRLDRTRHVAGHPAAVRHLLTAAASWEGVARLANVELLRLDGVPQCWRVRFEGESPLGGWMSDAEGEGPWPGR